MTESILAQAEAVEAAGTQDPEALQSFIAAFCGHDFWTQAEVKDHVHGRDLVSFSFNQLEGVDLPVLMLFCQKEEGATRVEGGGTALRSFSGAVVLAIAGRTRFHAALVDGDATHVLSHDRLLLMLRLGELGGSEAVPAQDPELLQQAAPRAFTRALYEHCRASPDIATCRIGLASSRGQAATLPDFLVLLEGTDPEIHRAPIMALAGEHLVPNQLVLLLDANARQEIERQYASVLRTFPPFYGKSHGQSWWSRLRRHFEPPQVPWIQLELTED